MSDETKTGLTVSIILAIIYLIFAAAKSSSDGRVGSDYPTGDSSGWDDR